ncbi:hypothetical protein [Streptomyces sp. MBT84]|uniref:hypothetical protein n=1 Tax=Streptomyces sp. MBT84 TaxID=1488414 RepID=UPI001C6E7A2B|nr:hypothetical protein [Streptomyces sp. MBT84]
MNVMLSATCAGRPAEAVRRPDVVHRSPARDGEPGAAGRWCGPATVAGSEHRPEVFGVGGHRGASARHAAPRRGPRESGAAAAAPRRTVGHRTRPVPDAARPAVAHHEERTG